MGERLMAAAEQLSAKLDGSDFNGSIKFDITDEGVIRIVDGSVVTEDGDADCTVTAEMDTFKELFEGELDPTAAYMTGKLKIDGDMGVAMKLGQLLG